MTTQQDIELPPLPDFGFGPLSIKAVTEQMRAYATAAVLAERADKERLLALQKSSYEREIALEVSAERERCAAVCDARVMGDNNREDGEARRCAAAIRGEAALQKLMKLSEDMGLYNEFGAPIVGRPEYKQGQREKNVMLRDLLDDAIKGQT